MTSILFNFFNKIHFHVKKPERLSKIATVSLVFKILYTLAQVRPDSVLTLLN